MCLDRSLPAKCRGFLLPSAIFLLVVMAGLAAFLINISNSQHIGSAQDVVGTRAYHAARSGLEWGFYHALVPAAVCPAVENVPLDATAFPGLSLTVTCVPTGATEEAGKLVTTNFYRITATACTQPDATTSSCPNMAPNPMYVERQLEAVVERPLPP